MKEKTLDKKQAILDSLAFNYLLYSKYKNMDKLTKASFAAGSCFVMTDILECYFNATTEELEIHKSKFLGDLPLERIALDDVINTIQQIEEIK